jgi:membrane protein
VLGSTVAQWFGQLVGLGSLFVTLWTWLRIPAAIVLMTLVLALIYYLFPKTNQPFRLITPGAIIAVIVWVAASLGFSFYVKNFANYSATYGAIAAVIVLLLYFIISAAIMLFGAEINAEVYHQITDGGEGEDDGHGEGESKG